MTLTDGNSETLGANASLVAEGEKEGLGSVIAGAEVNYGESRLTTEATDAGGTTTVSETNETTV